MARRKVSKSFKAKAKRAAYKYAKKSAYSAYSRRRNTGWPRPNAYSLLSKTEKKYVDTVSTADPTKEGIYNGSTFSETLNCVLIGNPSQGTGVNQRVGLRNTITKIQGRITIKTVPKDDGTLAFIPPHKIRVLIVYCRTALGVPPPLDAILQFKDTYRCCDSYVRWDSVNQYKVIVDKCLEMPGWQYKTSTGEYQQVCPATKTFKISKKVALPQLWGGTGDTISDCKSGALVMYIFCNNPNQNSSYLSGATATGGTMYNSYFRVTFVDP